MCASPDVFAHLTHLLMNLAGGKVCAVLEVRPRDNYDDNNTFYLQHTFHSEESQSAKVI